MIRKADVILTIALVVSGLLLSWFLVTDKENGSSVVISIDQEQVAEYSLMEDKDIVIIKGEISDKKPGPDDSEFNIIRIKEGKVSVIETDCRGKDCTRQGPVYRTGETIVCLPHKIMVEICGGEAEYDSISK